VTRLWTGAGDDGTTGLLFGGRVPKASARPEAIGSVDEAQACIGLARAEAERGSELDGLLTGLERDLWVLMAEIATDPSNRSKLVAEKTLVTDDMVRRLEALTDEIGARFEPPSEFVVPGQDRLSALLDVARTVVRRAERAAVAAADDGSVVVPYLNRLSSVLWTLARWVEGEALTSRQH
jgi:cob(I)alamin adenosyltransferase